jgi:preprotein translocase subunit SecY
MIYTILTNPTLTGGAAVGDLVQPLTGVDLVAFVLTLTAGSIFLMWLGELITENGIGNGASLIITFGIIAAVPRFLTTDLSNLASDWQNFLAGNFNFLFSNDFIAFYIIIAIIIAMTVVIVYFNEATRRIPIMYARRFRGSGGSDAENYLPIKLNPAGVIPVIFAQALVTFPQIISSFILSVRDSGRLYDFANELNQSAFLQFDTIEYILTFFVLTVGFTFFYTYVIVKPEELAKNLQKSGAFIPGIRPGNSTINYLNAVTARLTLWGSLFLATISVIPIAFSIFQGQESTSVLSIIGGTSLLITVSVFMNVYRKANSLKSVVSYEQYT